MWLWLSLCSALLLGIYDVAKKQALRRNGVLWILLCSTALTALFLCPWLSPGSIDEHIKLIFKALLVSSSWISGLIALKSLPLTTVSSIKASRPMFVVMFSIILFGERLSALQWIGVALVLAALVLLGISGKKEGIAPLRDRGMIWMAISVLTGSASALYDKHIMKTLEPLFVQSWSNVYITILIGILLLIKWLKDRGSVQRFKWDWYLVLIALLITISDALYFFALKDEGALLSVISMIRRSSTVITFVFGALVFKEHNIRDKAIDLIILLGGISLLLLSS